MRATGGNYCLLHMPMVAQTFLSVQDKHRQKCLCHRVA
jgi:hypothetical protein